MATRVDKVIVTNTSALRAKYGAAGWTKINDALDRLIASDARRQLTTLVVSVSDSKQMKSLRVSKVVTPDSPAESKRAIDGIYKAYVPDYLLILGAIDVVPHQDLKNPLYQRDDDDDRYAFGDIPYACDALYSQDPTDFSGPSRVVGRLPDLVGATDPTHLIRLLEVAEKATARSLKDYLGYLGVSAEVWEKSTRLSALAVFGAQAVETVPPSGPKWPATKFGALSHFFNCHGGRNDIQFYGQPGDGAGRYPKALEAKDVRAATKPGTVVAAECCYGAQLFDPVLTGGQAGICNEYLSGGAYGFFGSTTIAYGPADSNGQADLICQYFLQSVLGGASLGRAALEARQKFAALRSADPSDIKTLAQFNFYGDPSIQAVEAVPKPSSRGLAQPKTLVGNRFRTSTAEDMGILGRVDRVQRRDTLARLGGLLEEVSPRLRRSAVGPSLDVATALAAAARQAGAVPGKILSFRTRRSRPATLGLAKAMATTQATETGYHVLFARPASSSAGPRPKSAEAPESSGVLRIVLVIAREVEGRIMSVRVIESR